MGQTHLCQWPENLFDHSECQKYFSHTQSFENEFVNLTIEHILNWIFNIPFLTQVIYTMGRQGRQDCNVQYALVCHQREEICHDKMTLTELISSPYSSNYPCKHIQKLAISWTGSKFRNFRITWKEVKFQVWIDFHLVKYIFQVVALLRFLTVICIAWICVFIGVKSACIHFACTVCTYINSNTSYPLFSTIAVYPHTLSQYCHDIAPCSGKLVFEEMMEHDHVNKFTFLAASYISLKWWHICCIDDRKILKLRQIIGYYQFYTLIQLESVFSLVGSLFLFIVQVCTAHMQYINAAYFLR